MARHDLLTRSLLLTAAAALLLSAPAARAQEQASLGFGLGLVKPSDVDSTVWFTANYRFRLGDRLMLEPEAGYWKKSEEAFAIETSLEDLNFGGNVIFNFAGGELRPWVGAGLGVHLVKGTLGIGEVGSESETNAELGVHLLGGADYRLSETLNLFGAARFDLVSLEEDVDLNQFKAYFGIRYKF